MSDTAINDGLRIALEQVNGALRRYGIEPSGDYGADMDRLTTTPKVAVSDAMIEPVVACLGDDAARLRMENGGESEIADNMEEAAGLIESLFGRLPQPATAVIDAKYDDVLLPFARLMANELHANAGKGDRPGWLQMSAAVAMLEIYHHAAKLQKAVKDGGGDAIREHAADVANMAMMLLDVCGGLDMTEQRQPQVEAVDCGGCAPPIIAIPNTEHSAVPEALPNIKVCQTFMGEPVSPEMVAYHEGWNDYREELLSSFLTLTGKESFQSRVASWMGECFIPSLYSNMTERGDRLLEEVLELLQAHGYDRSRVATLVDYVFGRPLGEPAQEIGGVMVTLAGYCWIAGQDMHAAGETELARISQPQVMAKIRAKQEAKNALHFDTPLPGNIELEGGH